MPKCPICQKRGVITFKRVKLRGKYNPTTKVRKRVNLQWFLVPENVKDKKWKKFAKKRIKVCTKCRKALLKKLEKEKRGVG